MKSHRFFFRGENGKIHNEEDNRISRSGRRFILGCDHTATTYILCHQLKIGKYLLTFVIELNVIIPIQILQYNRMRFIY